MSEKIRTFNNLVKSKKTIYKIEGLKTFLIEKWLVILIISLFFSGMFLGSLYVNHSSGAIAEKITEYCKTLILDRSTMNNIDIFKNAICKYIIFILLTYFLGLFSLGVPFICLMPLSFGISNGVLCGYIYQNYSFRGLGYCLTTIYPSLMIVIILFILGACESIQMSIDTFKMQSDKSIVSTGNLLKKYTYRYLILVGILIVVCIFEALLCNLFFGYFGIK